jgi:F-type H+-transporting ATPase subunit b
MDFINNVLHSIGFNWHVALANFINFLIILFLLNKYFFRKVLARVNEREKLIREGVENARLAEKNLEIASEEAEQIILNSKKEAEKHVKDGVDRGEKLAHDLKLNAEEEINLLREDLKVKIKNANQTVEEEFASMAPELLKSMLVKVFKNADDDLHSKLISNLVK